MARLERNEPDVHRAPDPECLFSCPVLGQIRRRQNDRATRARRGIGPRIASAALNPMPAPPDNHGRGRGSWPRAVSVLRGGYCWLTCLVSPLPDPA